MKNLFSENSTIYIRDGVEHTACCYAVGEGEVTLDCSDGDISLYRRAVPAGEGAYKVTDVYKNLSEEKAELIFVMEVAPGYAPDFTLVPAVSYDGNRFGTNGDPKGLYCDGAPWVFGYSRTSLPSATVTEGEAEGKRLCTCIFAATDSKESLVSGGSIYVGEDGLARQRIYRPEVESPKTYSRSGGYGAPRYDKITLMPGESFTATSYIVSVEPEYPRFGVIKVYDFAAKVLDMTSAPQHSDEDIWRLGLIHTKNLLTHGHGGGLFVTGLRPSGTTDENGRIIYERCSGHHELGWCGQNSTIMLAYATDYFRNGNRESLDIALTAVDSWLRFGTRENGWLASHIIDLRREEVTCRINADTVNTGYGAMQMMKLAELLRENGMEKPELWEKLLALCELYCSLYSDEDGMPSAIAEDGTAASYVGTGGLFAGFALVTAYKYTKNEKYLDVAKRLVRYYKVRDLDLFACAAGALDTSCVDKESCCPFLHVALDLYEITGEAEWMEVAKKAAVYLVSWMFMFNVIYSEDSNFVKMGYSTKGGTVVSAKHAHIDPWGGVICADIERYARLSGNEVYHTFARLMWDNTTMAVSDGITPDPRGNIRPLGSQAEAYAHTHWFFDHSGDEGFPGGYINDWLVAWPAAHRLATLMRKWRGEL